MACDFKIKGRTLTQQEVNLILQQLGNNQEFKQLLIYDNYNRLTTEESEVYQDVIDFLQQTFNLKDSKEVWDNIKAEQLRREQRGKADVKKRGRNSITLNNIKDTPQKIKNFFRRQFSVSGKYSVFGKKSGRHAHNLNVRRENTIRAKASEAFRAQQRLNLAVAKVEKFLNPEDYIALSNILKGKSFDTLPLIKVRQDPNKLKIVQDILESPLKAQVKIISELQKLLADSKFPNPIQAEMILDSMGLYTTRLYEVHRNPDYASKFEKTGRVDKKGREEFRGGEEAQSIFENAVGSIRELLKIDKSTTEKELSKTQKALATYLSSIPTTNRTTQQDTTIKQFETKIDNLKADLDYYNTVLNDDEMLHLHVVNFLKDTFKNGNGSLIPDLGVGNERAAIGRSIFMKRNKDLSPEIRALLGEIRDPGQVFMSTVVKIVSAYANSQFQSLWYNMNETFTQEYDSATDKRNLPRPFFSKTARPELGLVRRVPLPESMAVLKKELQQDFFFTDPDFAEDIFEAVPEITNKYMNSLRVFNTIAKMGVTIFSFTTSLGNFLSNIVKLVATSVLTKNRSKFYGTILWSLKNRIAQEGSRLKNVKFGDFPDPYDFEYEKFQHVIQSQGIENSDIAVASIHKDIKNQEDLLRSLDEGLDVQGIKQMKDLIKVLWGLSFRTYAGGDNVIKEALFVHEANGYANALHRMDYDKLLKSKVAPEDIRKVEDLAGSAVRRTFPNYNETYEFVRTLSNSAFSFFYAPFIIFGVEMWRTTFETARLSWEEIRDTNPKIRTMGLKRAATVGVLAVLSNPEVLKPIISAISDDEEDEEKEIFAKEFDLIPDGVNAPVVTTDPETGYIKIFDYAQRNIAGNYSIIISNFNDVMRGLPADKSLFKFFKSTIEPLITPQVGTGSLVNLLSGVDQYGNPLFSSTDEPSEIVKTYLTQLFSPMVPGSIQTVWRNRKKAEAVLAQEAIVEDYKKTLPVVPSKEQLERLKLAEDELGRRVYALREDYQAMSSLRQHLVDPQTQFTKFVWDRVAIKADLSDEYLERVKEIGRDKITKRQRLEIYKDLTDMYQTSLKDLRRYYNRATDVGYDVEKLFEYGQQSSKDKSVAAIKTPFTKAELAYIMGKSEELPIKEIKEHNTAMETK